MSSKRTKTLEEKSGAVALSALLRAGRAKLNMTGDMVAKKVGLSGAAIYAWEQAKSTPNPFDLVKVLDFYGIPRTEAFETLVGVVPYGPEGQVNTEGSPRHKAGRPKKADTVVVNPYSAQ